MDYEIAFGADGIVRVRTWGAADPAVFRRYLRELVADPRWRPGSRTLIDHRALQTDDLSGEDIRVLSREVAALADQLGGGRNATVMSGTVAFGLGRMWELQTDGRVPAELRVFTDVDAARKWLEEDPDG